uniref:Spermatosis associated 1 n=1 Tax=Crocodylus porosus TaxID=8502 RepID=A0A7M4FJ85_CROPO
MSFSQTRPPTSELVELHVFYVPEDVWNFKLNTISADHISTFISAGFIRASPCLTLRTLREQLGKYLGEDAVADKFRFLKCIGKKLAVVKAKQETELELKLFAPPYALYPELYFLPGLDHLESIYSSSSTTSERQHFYEDAAVPSSYVHGSTILNLPKRKLEKSLAFLESPPINHLSQNQEEHGSSGWNKNEKEIIQVLHDSKQHEGVQNNRNQEKLIPQRRKEIELAEQLEQRKAERLHMERIREELIKKAKGLLEQNQLKRYHARQAWKKKYFETKKATASLEDYLNKLRQDLELSHQKLLSQLEARHSWKRAKNTTHVADSKNATIIQITTEQHEINHLKRKLDNIKMKLTIEIKMRKQAASDLRVLRAELAQKKIQSSLMLQTGKLVI